MVNLTPQLELAAAVVFPRNWLQVLGSIEAHQCLGIEKRTKINRWNSGSESCTGVGVVVGFSGPVGMLNSPHVQMAERDCLKTAP